MERYLQQIYTTLTDKTGLTPALSRKLTGMARDYILEYGVGDWTQTYAPTTDEGVAKFVDEAVRVLNSDARYRHYVMDDPFARQYFVARKPRETKTASSLPTPQSVVGRPVPAPPSRPPSPPAPKPKKEKKKAKKEKTPAVDPDMAFLDAEIARQEADAEEQAEAQAREFARLRAEALAGNAEAQASLDRIYDIVSRQEERLRRRRG